MCGRRRLPQAIEDELGAKLKDRDAAIVTLQGRVKEAAASLDAERSLIERLRAERSEADADGARLLDLERREKEAAQRAERLANEVRRGCGLL